LIEGLLNRDPTRRLGGSKADAAELISHEFFKGVNWVSLIEKQMTPPFVPALEADEDVKYIE
jgi:RAC serine/threonine-protein kinase